MLAKAACGLSFVGVGAVSAEPMIDVAFYAPSPLEQKLSSALDEAFETEGAQVNCISPNRFDFRARKLVYPHAFGYAQKYTHTLWLHEDVCNNLADFVALPSEQKSHSENITYTAVAGVRALTHEGAHAISNISNEADTECATTKTAVSVAKALGVTAAAVPAFSDSITDLQKAEQEYLGEQYHIDVDACRS